MLFKGFEQQPANSLNTLHFEGRVQVNELRDLIVAASFHQGLNITNNHNQSLLRDERYLPAQEVNRIGGANHKPSTSSGQGGEQLYGSKVMLLAEGYDIKDVAKVTAELTLTMPEQVR